MTTSMKCILIDMCIFFCLAGRACPVTISINELEESMSCKLTAITNYLTEVLMISPIASPLRVTDRKCFAEISHRSPNGEEAFHIQACTETSEEWVGAYCKTEESTPGILLKVTCGVSWRDVSFLQLETSE